MPINPGLKRAPRKFTDKTESEIAPEWKAWYAEASEFMKDEVREHLVDSGYVVENYYPEEYDKDVAEGAWIIVVEEPHTELKSRFTVPTPSLWWARPEPARPYGQTYGSGSMKVSLPGPYRVIIETPGGSLWLFPHEYVVCEHPLVLLTDPDVTIYPLGGRVPLSEEKREQLFYLQQRGITYADALLLIMDGVDMRDWGWVEFPEDVRAALDGVGRRIHLNA